MARPGLVVITMIAIAWLVIPIPMTRLNMLGFKIWYRYSSLQIWLADDVVDFRSRMGSRHRFRRVSRAVVRPAEFFSSHLNGRHSTVLFCPGNALEKTTAPGDKKLNLSYRVSLRVLRERSEFALNKGACRLLNMRILI
jgi:hypothetical protein